MKVKYKITYEFGDQEKGDIIDAFILNIDDDSGIALCYHPSISKWECGLFEFIKRSKKDNVWISAFSEKVYSNQGSGSNINKEFKKFLKCFVK